MQRIFTTGEEVQVWVHEQDRTRKHGGRQSLQYMLSHGDMSVQSEALAREWIGTHPLREDRREFRSRAALATPPIGLGRRSGDQGVRGTFAAPLALMALLIVLACTTPPFWRHQTVFSHIDGGFNTADAEMARARRYELVDSSGRRFVY